ncbi:histidine kinase [Streptomyces albidoflavus]
MIAAQRATRAAQQETLAAVTRERDAKIGEALALERAAMARELHDIVAHRLSGISLMASVVARQTASAPGEARSGALEIRKQSNATSHLQRTSHLFHLVRLSASRSRRPASPREHSSGVTFSVQAHVRTLDVAGPKISERHEGRTRWRISHASA